ncbi:MAG TPA: hypothetical protein VFE02_11685 [Candidatus Acidoferrales bacterium]|jgi:hypothetical protein|nr:hypothetical protein [Candidatus Acidoferrales bacterium]
MAKQTISAAFVTPHWVVEAARLFDAKWRPKPRAVWPLSPIGVSKSQKNFDSTERAAVAFPPNCKPSFPLKRMLRNI